MCILVGTVDCIENAKRLIVSRVSIFGHQKLVSLETLVHISFAVKRVFPKELEPMLSDSVGNRIRCLPTAHHLFCSSQRICDIPFKF